jgi:hypothetical protein
MKITKDLEPNLERDERSHESEAQEKLREDDWIF